METEPVLTAPISAIEEAPEPALDDRQGIPVLPVILGGLLVLAFAIWGFVAIGRRKPTEVRAAAIERPLPKQPEPVAATVPTTPPAETSVPETVASERVTPIGPPRTTFETGLPHAGASVALPRKIPESFEERNALIERMIAAKPDRANPFTSPAQRRKRAKLILQSLGRDFGDAGPRIDLSQYPHNWPELAGKKHAAA